MAGSGGAWKVAYADFVTAMMAFFLVMWLVSQDEKVREAVAEYFVDPMNQNASSAPTKSPETGTSMVKANYGDLRRSRTLHVGRGRESYSDQSTDHLTQTVSNWILDDEQAFEHWQDRAARILETVAKVDGGKSRREQREELAITRLADEMRSSMVTTLPSDMTEINLNMLDYAISSVNWNQIAEDVFSYGPTKTQKK
jgi:chemotaxis protein MotB